MGIFEQLRQTPDVTLHTADTLRALASFIQALPQPLPPVIKLDLPLRLDRYFQIVGLTLLFPPAERYVWKL